MTEEEIEYVVLEFNKIVRDVLCEQTKTFPLDIYDMMFTDDYKEKMDE